MELFNTGKGAEFSECRQYRYVLWRMWDEGKPMVCFIGLNPSTANEHDDDPTIRRVIGFAKQWGYGGVYMLNLFAIISSKPEILATCADPLGDNDKWLDEFVQKCERVVFAWGNFKEAMARARAVAARYPGAYCLVKNKNGSPMHPLYVSGDTVPVLFNK